MNCSIELWNMMQFNNNHLCAYKNYLEWNMTENKFTFQLSLVISTEWNSNTNESTHHICDSLKGHENASFRVDTNITFVAKSLISWNAISRAFYGHAMIRICASVLPHSWFNCHFQEENDTPEIWEQFVNSRVIIWLNYLFLLNLFPMQPLLIKILYEAYVSHKSMKMQKKSSVIDFTPTMKTEIFTFRLHLLIGFCILLKRGQYSWARKQSHLYSNLRMSFNTKGKIRKRKVIKSNFSLAETFEDERPMLIWG